MLDFLHSMRVERTFRRLGHLIVSGVLALILLLALLLTASPVLHRFLHSDAPAEHHHCLACALQKGHVTSAETAPMPCLLPIEVVLPAGLVELSATSPPDYRLSPSRAPSVS